jgi:hypothetical protein
VQVGISSHRVRGQRGRADFMVALLLVIHRERHEPPLFIVAAEDHDLVLLNCLFVLLLQGLLRPLAQFSAEIGIRVGVDQGEP